MQNNLNGTLRNLWTFTTALVWLINGLWCKLLNGVPRHRSIVAEILGAAYATPLTLGIGALEVLMAIWIVSGIRTRLCIITQIATIATMNTLEYVLVPDLLLFGRWNAFFATLFIAALAVVEWTRPTAGVGLARFTHAAAVSRAVYARRDRAFARTDCNGSTFSALAFRPDRASVPPLPQV